MSGSASNVLAILAIGALLLAGCSSLGPLSVVANPTPHPALSPADTAAVPPEAASTGMPGSTLTPAPTLCAQARIGGRLCAPAGQVVTLSSCCPEWSAKTVTDAHGQFEFAALTAGTFTVASGGYRQEVNLRACDSVYELIDPCPPTPLTGQSPTPRPNVDAMVHVPAGTFAMGCDSSVESCLADESPLHSVWLDGFYIDKYEVTNGQYARCLQAGACTPIPLGSDTRQYYFGMAAYEDYPVVNVTWHQAAAYCAWVGKRLPTEAEWEKAARGSWDTRRYPWGNAAPTCSLANIAPCAPDTARVGSYPSGASPYGALDMVGNAWEWTADWYAENYYSGSPTANPAGPAAGIGKVLRGGSWWDDSSWARVAKRTMDNPANAYNRLGFRCVKGE